MSSPPTLVWLRIDLRLADHPALHAAIARGGPVIPVFIWAPEEEEPWPPGAASRWWLHQSLARMEDALHGIGLRLVIRRGPSLATLRALVKETGAGAVEWNRRYEPALIARDKRIKEALRGDGVAAESHNGALLHEPWTVQNRSGRPFQVFTPYWRHCLEKGDPGEPLAAPTRVVGPSVWPKSLALAALELEPKIRWAEGFRKVWEPGEVGAHRQLERFLHGALAAYTENRDRPDLAGTSRLSPHLHFGEISPRQIWHALPRHFEAMGAQGWRSLQFVTELGWREFAHHLLYHFPQTPERPLRPEFERFPWVQESAVLGDWRRGGTGYPIVDAGMRELWATGWMHNRVRMIVASFLVKDLQISWTEGSRWFWDTLVDADLAQNTLGWQWTAGCGADAAPYFRVFNPTSQGAKFDPLGEYVRKWCPELARLPTEYLHAPHEAPPDGLARAEVELGRTYPHPLVNHARAREAALRAFAEMKGGE
jgi:deoxyribodipyrimidine photo-lyase